MKKIALLLFLLAIGVLQAQSPARTGKDYAVFFYATDFKYPIADLPDTRTEAVDLAAELKNNYGFICKFMPECTRTDIENELKAWNKKLGPNDQILYFFSMHGYYDGTSDRGYLIPADGEPGAEHNYFASWLSYDDLRTLLAPCKAQHVLVALDACYSGSFGIRSSKKIPGGDVLKPKVVDCSTLITNAFTYKARQFITAGKMNQTTPGKSEFAATILKNLRVGYNADGVLWLDDLAHQLHKLKNPEPEDGKFIGHQDGADFVFVRKNACATPPPPAETLDARLIRDYAAWTNADATQNYKQYMDEWCPGGQFCVAAEAKWKAATATPEQAEKPQVFLDKKVDPLGLVFVTGGTFTMGCSSEQQDCGSDEKPAHSVTVSDFFIGKYEVTVGEFKTFMEATTNYQTDAEKEGSSYIWTGSEWKSTPGINWRHDTGGKLRPVSEYNHPVIHVSWNDAVAYCEWLSKKHGKVYRLPTEAEWEYAARGGGKAVLFGNGKNVADPKEINFDGSAAYKKPYSVAGTYRVKTVPVGSLNSPNALGLHDMSGNVWEWCSDWYGAYTEGTQRDPQGPDTGSGRVIRGGSWDNYPQNCRVANRDFITPGFRYNGIGFRLARAVTP